MKDRLGRVMNDPSFVYGEVYGPMITVERSIVLLQDVCSIRCTTILRFDTTSPR